MIQIVSVAGHTDESVAIIDHANQLAFLGDFVYNGTLFVFDSDDLPKYLDSIIKIQNLINAEYSIYAAHGAGLIPFERFETVKNLLQCMIASDCFTTYSTSAYGHDATIYESLDQQASIMLFH